MDPMHEADDLRADLRRVEAENERLSAAILDCRSELNRANLRVLELDAKNARQARLLMDSSDEIDGLEVANAELASQLETAQYMREVVGQCRDDAEDKARRLQYANDNT